MTPLPERQQLVERFNHAVASGARKAIACAEIGLSLRSLQRWALTPVIQADERTTTLRPQPLNALSSDERRAILEVCNSPPFASLPPSQIVPRLADQGRYLASEATFYRLLKAADPAFCKVVGASAVFLSCYFQCRLLPLWVERDGADGLPIPRRA